MAAVLYEIPKKLSNYDISRNAVGIDFGTTECCAAVIRKNGPEFVVLDPITRLRTMPSFIAFDEKTPKCGQIAIDRMRHQAEHTVYDIKRILGKSYDEIVIDPIWPFKILAHENGSLIEVNSHEGKIKMDAEEVAGDLFCNIKKNIEAFVGEILTDVVITVPSEVSEKQKAATKIAAEYAGGENIRFIPEPVAAAFAYFSEINIPNNSTILICDFGGGTVDICIAKSVNDSLKVLTYNGDSYLGGRDFDRQLYDHFASILTNKHHINLSKNNKNCILKQKCQDIKHSLSVLTETRLDVCDFSPDSDEIIKITRDEFERMTTNLMVRTKNVILNTLSKASLQKHDINYIFQVGGGCQMPMIKNLLSNIFPCATHRCNISPDWVVAQGAAAYAYHLKREKPKLPQKYTKFITAPQFEPTDESSRVENSTHTEQYHKNTNFTSSENNDSKSDNKSSAQSNTTQSHKESFIPDVDASSSPPVSQSATNFGFQSETKSTAKNKPSSRPSSFDEIVEIVIDNGSSIMKAGFAGDISPTSVFSTLVGYQYISCGRVNSFVGSKAQLKRDVANIYYPIQHGIITNWQGMETVWHHIFYDELKIAPEDHPVLLTENPLNPKTKRKHMMEIMFETFNTPVLYPFISAQLALFTAGRTTGFVLDCGGATTCHVPVYEGYILPNAVKCSPFGGSDVTDFLFKELRTNDKSLTNSDRENVREMKEKLCFVANDFEIERKRAFSSDKSKNPHIADVCNINRKVNVAEELFKCPELLFQPSMFNLEYEGIHRTSYQSITECDPVLHKEMYSNITLAGGSSLFPGFADRIKKEMTNLAPSSFTINVIAPDNRKHAAWIGGSILASLNTFQDMWISRQEYYEYGPSIVHRKYF